MSKSVQCMKLGGLTFISATFFYSCVTSGLLCSLSCGPHFDHLYNESVRPVNRRISFNTNTLEYCNFISGCLLFVILYPAFLITMTYYWPLHLGKELLLRLCNPPFHRSPTPGARISKVRGLLGSRPHSRR